jgi:sulfide:quinone oxidoreductase
MASRTVVMLGGGVGGQVAANTLRRLLPKEHRVVLIEREANHAFAPSFLWVMTGERSPGRITRPLRRLLVSGVELVTAAVTRIDVERRRVDTDGGEVAYDYLVIALGAELAPDAIPGLAAAHSVYTLDGASRLHEALQSFPGGRVAVVVSSLPYKCPGAPYETAMLIADAMGRRGLTEKGQVHLFTPEPQPLPVAGPALGAMVSDLLARKGIDFHPGKILASVDGPGRRLEFKDGAREAYDLLVAVPPHRPPAVVRESGLGDEAGWIPVDRASLTTSRERVYAIGDVTAIALPGRWNPEKPLPLPKAGVFAHGQALAVARRIAHDITGAGEAEGFCAGGYCMLEAGEEMAGFAYGDFYGEPSPKVKLRKVGRSWHLGKVLFEKWWLASGGLQRGALRLALVAGGRAFGVRIEL